MNTASLESMASVMTGNKRCCDVAHSCSVAIKTPPWAGLSLPLVIGKLIYFIEPIFSCVDPDFTGITRMVEQQQIDFLH